jgi:hypothetical protein
MEKETLLTTLRAGLRDGVISRADIELLVSQARGSIDDASASKTLNLSGVLYYVGGGIAFLGIGIFVGDNWEYLSSALRIFLTLGAGLAFFAAASLLESTKLTDRIPEAFHFLGGLLIPGGIFVTLYELGFRGSDFGPGFIFLALALCYGLAAYVYRHNLLLAFALCYGILAYFLITEAMAGGIVSFDRGDYLAYRFVGIGASLMVLGYAFRSLFAKVLTPWLYGFGVLAVLGGAFALQGFEPNQSIFWEIVYPGLVFGAMFIAIYLRSRAVLMLGAAFLVGDIFKLTSEYFRDSLGWPLMLVLAGFLLIGVGYLTFYLNSKYIKTAIV